MPLLPSRAGLKPKRRSRSLLGLAALCGLLLGLPAPAQACYPGTLDFPFVRSSTRACVIGNCNDVYTDYLDPTRPAVSQSGNSYGIVGTSISAGSRLAIDNGYFFGVASSGGYSQIHAISTYYASARALGELHECLTVSGGAGAGRLHLPLHLTGAIQAGWAITGSYQLPPNVEPQTVDVHVLCGQVGALGDCNDPYFRFHESHVLDEQLELTVEFAFDQKFYLVIESRVQLSYGVPANGETGALTGMVEGKVLGRYGAAYVTDTSGTPIPGAVITSGSGYDYTQPVPEPDAPAAGAAAGLALALLRRRRSTRSG